MRILVIPRGVIETDILPRFLRYDERFPGLGFWAAIEKASGDFIGWFSFWPADAANPYEVKLSPVLFMDLCGSNAMVGITMCLPRKPDHKPDSNLIEVPFVRFKSTAANPDMAANPGIKD